PEMIEAGREAARRMLGVLQHSIAGISDPPEISMKDDTVLRSLREIRVYGTTGEFPDTAFLHDRTFLGKALLRSSNLKLIEHRLLEDYRSHGYTLVRIDSVVLHPGFGRADLYMDEGRIGRIVVHGDPGIDSEVALHELSFARGDVFRASEGERSLQHLTGTGLFDFAVIQISYDTSWPGTQYVWRPDTIAFPQEPPSLEPAVILTVRARSPNVLRLGALADNEFGAEFSAEFANENVGGSGIEYSLIGSLGALARSASFTLNAPRLFHSFGVLDASIYSGYRDINVYQLETVAPEHKIVSSVTDVVRESRDLGLRLQAGGQVERLGAITAELRVEQQRWFSTRDSANDQGTDDLRALRGELLVDSRDDGDYPHIGTLIRAYAETGLTLFGHGTNYTKLFGEMEGAIPLSALHTLLPRIRLGFGDALLPRLETFALGGMESFYGLNEYELRGKQMLEGSLSYQIAIPHSLFFPTFVSIRYDIGAVWPEPT